MKQIGNLIAFLIIIQLVTICGRPLSAQKIKPTQVPDEVIQTLDYQNPNVKILSWEIVDKNYVANFKDDGIPGRIFISPSGTWLRTTYNVRVSELPSSITDYVKRNYTNYIISTACIEELENESTHYYIETKTEGIGFEPSILTFDNNGKLLTRKDPANFKDQLAQNMGTPKTAENKIPAKNTNVKPTSAKTSTTKTAAAKTASKSNAAKSATKSTAAKSASKSTAAKSASKSTAAKSATKPTAAKSATKPVAAKSKKPAKPKKVKPEPIIKDESGNIALKPNTIPASVTKAFSKKIFHPEELHWFFIDSMYVAKCINTGKKTAAYITPQGVWVKTLMVQPEEAITGPMLKYLNDYYKGFKFKNAINEQRADKKNKTIVEFYEKSNYKSKLVTTAIFDKSGRLLRTIDPDYALGHEESENPEDADLEKYYEKMNMGLSSEEAVNVPENVKAAFRLKYPRITEVEWQEDDLNYQAIYYDSRGKQICVINNYGTIVETMTLGKPGNLSATIANYIKKAHKGSKVVEYYTVKKIEERKSFYKVIVSNKKTGEENELWFNTAGKPVDM